MLGSLEVVYLLFIVGATIVSVVLRDTGRAGFWGAAAVIALVQCVLMQRGPHDRSAIALAIPFFSIPIALTFSIARLGRKRSPVLIGVLAGLGNVSALVLETVLLISAGLDR